MADGSIWQIKLHTEVLGKDCLNVFHFRQGPGTVGGNLAEEVLNAFWAQIDAELLACIHPANTVSFVEGVELDFPAAFGSVTISDPGTWVDADERGPAQRNQTMSFRYQRAAANQRHGYKRFSGMSADAVEDGKWGSALVTKALDLELKLEAGFTAGTILFQPFVASRPIVVGSNPSGYVPLAAVFYNGGTQNTRK